MPRRPGCISVGSTGQLILSLDSIVIVKGLNGHPRHSLKADGPRETPSKWLEELLPQKIPSARVMLFGYESLNTGQNNLLSADGLSHAAEALLAALLSNRVHAEVSPRDLA